MERIDRCGARRNRQKKIGSREPDLGYYQIITDTDKTEKYYFEGLRDSIPEQLRNRIVIKVVKEKTVDLVKRAIELRDYDPQYRVSWIVFDRDKVKDFDTIIQHAEKANINVGWSNPCIEIWFYTYFDNIPTVHDSVICCSKFSEKYKRITGQEYQKSDKDFYKKLLHYGNEENAITMSENKMIQLQLEGKNTPSEMYSANTVYKLIKEVNSKKLV